MLQKGQKVSKIGQCLETFASHAVQHPEAVTSLCLHGNSLKDLEGLRAFCRLENLNLSSNCLTSKTLDGELPHLVHLTSLDLASNQITSLGNISSLSGLKRLNLAHNFLSSLRGYLSADAGDTAVDSSASAKPHNQLQQHMLEELDLQDNILANVNELQPLQKLSRLRRLHLHDGSPGNGFCTQPGYKLAVASLLPQLEMLDGCDLMIERLQLARDPQAAVAYLSQAAETGHTQLEIVGPSWTESATDNAALPHGLHPSASPQCYLDVQHQSAAGSWMRLAAPGSSRSITAGYQQPSALFQQQAAFQPAMEPQPFAASAPAHASLPSGDPVMWDAAWRSMYLQDHQSAAHQPLAEISLNPEIATFRQRPGLDLGTNGVPTWPAKESVNLQGLSQGGPQRSLPYDKEVSQRDPAANSVGFEQNQQHASLHSTANAHQSKPPKQQGPVGRHAAANTRSSSPGHPTTVLPTADASISHHETAPLCHQQSSSLGAGNKTSGDAEAAGEQQGSAGRGNGAMRGAKVDAACQVGDNGVLIDRLQQDADRFFLSSICMNAVQGPCCTLSMLLLMRQCDGQTV